ncbi:HTH domain-containing protein [Gammaproteobacteria bacterium]
MKLTIRIAEPFETMKKRMNLHARQADAGQHIEPLCEIGFENIAQFSEIFTTQRWKLVEILKNKGPFTIHELDKQMKRHGVQEDVQILMEWMLVEQDDSGQIFIPWDEIDIHWPLLKKAV